MNITTHSQARVAIDNVRYQYERLQYKIDVGLSKVSEAIDKACTPRAYDLRQMHLRFVHTDSGVLLTCLNPNAKVSFGAKNNATAEQVTLALHEAMDNRPEVQNQTFELASQYSSSNPTAHALAQSILKTAITDAMHNNDASLDRRAQRKFTKIGALVGAIVGAGIGAFGGIGPGFIGALVGAAVGGAAGLTLASIFSKLRAFKIESQQAYNSRKHVPKLHRTSVSEHAPAPRTNIRSIYHKGARLGHIVSDARYANSQHPRALCVCTHGAEDTTRYASSSTPAISFVAPRGHLTLLDSFSYLQGLPGSDALDELGARRVGTNAHYNSNLLPFEYVLSGDDTSLANAAAVVAAHSEQDVNRPYDMLTLDFGQNIKLSELQEVLHERDAPYDHIVMLACRGDTRFQGDAPSFTALPPASDTRTPPSEDPAFLAL